MYAITISSFFFISCNTVSDSDCALFSSSNDYIMICMMLIKRTVNTLLLLFEVIIYKYSKTVPA